VQYQIIIIIFAINDPAIINAAKALGLAPTTPKVVQAPIQNTPAAKTTHVNQQLQNEAAHYAAKRQQILKQNAERKKAHYQRLANLQKQRQQKAHAQQVAFLEALKESNN